MLYNRKITTYLFLKKEALLMELKATPAAAMASPVNIIGSFIKPELSFSSPLEGEVSCMPKGKWYQRGIHLYRWIFLRERKKFPKFEPMFLKHIFLQLT